MYDAPHNSYSFLTIITAYNWIHKYPSTFANKNTTRLGGVLFGIRVRKKLGKKPRNI
jgi:hypothetical protein